jgi:hypothetical protein
MAMAAPLGPDPLPPEADPVMASPDPMLAGPHPAVLHAAAGDIATSSAARHGAARPRPGGSLHRSRRRGYDELQQSPPPPATAQEQ